MKNETRIRILLLFAVLAFAVFLRLPTFALPHDNGDQVFYIGLAMKLDNFGFSEYTLRRVDTRGNDFILGLFPAEEGEGNLLKGLAKTGVTYYDEPLFHRSYGFPYTLMLSHRIFYGGEPYLALKTTGRNEKGEVYSKDAGKTWFSQFYAAIIPFLFSLLFILATYFLAKSLFSNKIALISAFLISISPIEILCSQKIWADTMLSFFVVSAVALFFLAKGKENPLFSFLAGIACGIAVLVKQTGGFIVIAILIFHLWQNRSRVIRPNEVHRVLFDKYLLLLGLGLVITCFHWFYAVTTTYGNPVYTPGQPGIEQQASWFMFLSQRPRFLHLVSMPYMVPLFVLAYLAVLAGPFIKGFIDEKKAFLVIWALTFLGILMIMNTKENRHMLPAYPAIAMLSADILQRVGNFIDTKFKKYYGDVFIILVLIACAFYSAPIGVRHAMVNAALIRAPF